MKRNVLKRTAGGWLAAAAITMVLGACSSSQTADKPAATAPQATAVAAAKLGTYDSRAVAIAYGRSSARAQWLTDLRTRHQKAVDAGNTRLADELSKAGESSQIRMHLQAFSNAPVDDALETVRGDLAGIAERAGVCAIVSSADYCGPATQVVDVTDEIVKLFKPDQQTLAIVKDCRTKKALPIEQIAQLPANK